GQGGATSSDVTSTATVNTVSTISTATSTTGDVEPEPPTPEEFFPFWTCPERPSLDTFCTQWFGGFTEDGRDIKPALEVGVCQLDVWQCAVDDCFYVDLTSWASE